jgi:hypothetical protein
MHRLNRLPEFCMQIGLNELHSYATGMVQGWINDPPVTVEPFQFSPAEPVAYDWS